MGDYTIGESYLEAMNIGFAMRELSVQTVQSCPTHLSQLRGLRNKHVRTSVCRFTDFSSQHVHIGKINQSLTNGLPFTREGPTLFQSQYSYVFIFIILKSHSLVSFFNIFFMCISALLSISFCSPVFPDQ